MKSEAERAKERFDAALMDLRKAIVHEPSRQHLTRDQLLVLVDLALDYGFWNGHQQAQSEATNERILGLLGKIRGS